MKGDERVFDVIEQSGGRVVLDGTESGLRTLPAPLQRRRLRDDPLLELMDAYFGAIPDAFRRPDTALYQWLTRELAASAALPGKGGCTLFAQLRKGDCPLFPEPVRKRGQPPFPNGGKGDSPLFRSPPAAYAARGVIVWRYVWCDMWAASAARLREATGLPVLDLDVSGDESGLARTAGRIQAFMEVLR
jgi:hypothetical protein